MLDKLEIYPYQRLVEENQARKRKRRTRLTRQAQVAAVLARARTRWDGFSHFRELNLTGVLTLRNLLMWGAAFILARAFILGEILPFIYALAAASADRKQRVQAVGVALFAILGFLTTSSGYFLWSNVVGIVAVAAALQAIQVPHQKRWVALPVLTAALLITSKTCFLLFNQPSFYREMIIIFEALIAGVLTFVMMVAREAHIVGKGLEEFNFEDVTAYVILGTGLIIGLHDVQVLGLSVTSILCRLGILLAAYLWGSGGGTMVGVVAGVVPALSAPVFPQTLGMYAVSGLVAGLFRHFGRLGVIVGFMLGTLMLSAFIVTPQEILPGVWETCLAALAFFFLPESIKERVPIKVVSPLKHRAGETDEAALVDEHLREVAQERIRRLAHILEELSSTFAETDSGDRPGTGEKSYLNMLFDEVSQGFCQNCSVYGTCWEKDFYRTYKDLFDVFSLAEANGAVSSDELPSGLRSRCIRPRELATAVNRIFENLRMNEYWEGRLHESKELICNQLRGVSEIIRNLGDELNLEANIDQELRSSLLQQCRRAGLRFRDLTPVRTGNKLAYLRMVFSSCTDGEACNINVAPTISNLMGEKYEVCERKCPRQMGKGACEFTLARAFAYRVVSGAAQLARENVSGDSFTVATLKDGKELLVLSDGMGVGRRAAMESRAVVNLLEELLTNGFAKDVALKTINSILLLRSPSETFATVDLGLVDLYSAEADFIKIGSAPAFIKRGRQVGVISSSTPPIGILNKLDTVSERKALFPGDMLVMVTDGVLDSPRDGADRDEWLRHLLAHINENDPHRLSDVIINRALERCHGRPRDDMTVLCARIEQA